MDPAQLANTISTLQGIITGTVGCTIVCGVAAVVLWRRVTKIEDEQKKELASLVERVEARTAALTEKVAEEIRESRDVSLKVAGVLEAILVELRRSGVEPSVPNLRLRGGG